MKTDKYKTEFLAETGTNWENSQGEPDIDYVTWLEEKLFKVLPDLEAAEKEIEKLKNVIEDMKDNGRGSEMIPVILCSKCFSFAVTIDGKRCSSMKSGSPCRGYIHNLNVTRKDYRRHQENNTWHEIQLPPPPAEG